MFKKLTGALVITLGLVGSLFLGAEETHAKSPVRVKEEAVVTSNVGDGQEYAYEITEIKGKEVHGKPLNKGSHTNRGIFLYKEEIGFDVKVGDSIVVVWGEVEDEFVLIDHAVKLKNGDYVSKTKLRIDNLLKKLRNKNK